MIRQARDADAAAVAALINAINVLGPGAAERMTPAIVLRALICAQPKAMLRVADEDGRVVGFATAALMAALAAEALREGARCLWWGVDEGDDEATLFHRSIGARSEGMFSGELIEGPAPTRLAERAR